MQRSLSGQSGAPKIKSGSPRVGQRLPTESGVTTTSTSHRSFPCFSFTTTLISTPLLSQTCQCPVAIMSARAGLRFFAQQSSRQSQFNARSQFRQYFQRRAQTTASNPAAETAAPQQSFLQRIWTSEVGVKTVHFWYVYKCHTRGCVNSEHTTNA